MRRCSLYIFVFLFSGVQAFASNTPLLDKAEELYRSKDYEQAAGAFSQVLANTEDTDLKQQCLLRLGDCIQMGWLEGRGTSDVYYAQVLEQGYSPYLLQAFRKWRASYHENHYGMTNAGWNLSYFAPGNKLYNSMKERVLQVIGGHLKKHPDDAIALAQQQGLRQLSDIEPGGPFGSSVLDESADLWPKFSE